MLRFESKGSLKEGSDNSRSNELAHSGGQKLGATRWCGHCGSQSGSALIYRSGVERSGEPLAQQQEPRVASPIDG